MVKLQRTRLVHVLITAVFAALVWSVVPVRSQTPSSNDTSNEIVRQKIRADKKALVAQNLQLTDSEAQAFWPMYEELQKAMTALGDRTARTIKEYAENYQNLPDATAKKLTDDWLTIQEDRVKLLQSYLPKFRTVLPEKKVARYYQLENKTYAVVLYDLVRQIPLAK
jgi:hypothetical protein